MIFNANMKMHLFLVVYLYLILNKIAFCKSDHPAMKKEDAKSNFGECGTSERLDLRVVGGKNARLGDWPWMVALSDSKPFSLACGGTLISKKWILTAGHCFDENQGYTINARLGIISLHSNVTDQESPKDYLIAKVIRHHNYSLRPHFVNNIALLQLENEVNFTENIRPICLPSGKESEFDGIRPYVIGFGAIRSGGPLTITDNSKCALDYSKKSRALIDDRMLCTEPESKIPCEGDSGGPLIFPVITEKYKTKYFLGGIISHSMGCFNPFFPAVYTRVAAYNDWIRKITGLSFN